MKLLKESIDYEISLPTEEDVAEFIACHIPSEECVKAKIAEINPGFNYEENIYFKIRDKIESIIRSTVEEFSCDEADALSYIDIVFDDIKAHAFNDPELESIYDIKEPVEVVDSVDSAEEVKSPRHLRDVLKGIDAIYIYNDARQAHLKGGLADSEENPKPYKSETEEQPLEEAVQVQYFRITYKHETGIYATDAVEASTYDEAVKIFNERGKGELISCDPISKDEYEEIIKGLEAENLTEDLNVNVDTEEQNINVAAEENAAVEVKVAPKDCSGVECDAEAELAELAKDPKYAKAFAYLMSTLQGESVEDQPAVEPAAEISEESAVESEPITESVSEISEDTKKEEDIPAEEEVEDATPENPEEMYVATTLNGLTKSEYDTINQYNDFLLTVQNMVTKPEDVAEEDFKPAFCPELAAAINDVIKDILAEENKHIGQLQELLKKVSPNAENIEAGVEEAKEQIEESPEKLEKDIEGANKNDD